MSDQPKLAFLLDTNAVITLEPFAGESEPNHDALATFLVLAREHHHRVAVHPANEDDLRETGDAKHRAANIAALRKYEMLVEPPIPSTLLQAIGRPELGSNDHRDLRLLSAVYNGAASYFVTSDEKLIKRAGRAGMSDQVVRPGEALDLLRQLHPVDPPAPPRVQATNASLLDLTQPIFDSLRSDYPGFDEWIRKKVAPDPSRRTWIVVDDDSNYQAIAIVKPNDDHPLNPGERATKISTFKVDDRAEGEKLGELLLKTVLSWAHEMRAQNLFVTVIDDENKQGLVRFLERFGFTSIGRLPNSTNEFAFEKRLWPSPATQLSPLEYHITYGPPAIDPTAVVYVVPVQPRWYAGLFPDSPVFGGDTPLLDLIVETGPFGNALRKAYLSNSRITEIPAGATLLFYRSADPQRSNGAVHAIGVAERTLRSADPVEVLSLVGRRTVYTAAEVARMCESELIAVMFRQDRFLPDPWSLTDLVGAGVLNGPPQAIMQVRSVKGLEWIRRQLSV